MNFVINHNEKSFTLNGAVPELKTIKFRAEKKFKLKKGSYKLSYLDIDRDPIAIEDDDDLAVCILEFSEMSKFDEKITLVIQEKDAVIPKRKDAPKGSRDVAFEDKTKSVEDGFTKILTPSDVVKAKAVELQKAIEDKNKSELEEKDRKKKEKLQRAAVVKRQKKEKKKAAKLEKKEKKLAAEKKASKPVKKADKEDKKVADVDAPKTLKKESLPCESVKKTEQPTDEKEKKR